VSGLRKFLAIGVGAVLSAMAGMVGFFVSLIGTQGMHGTEPFLEVFGFVTLMLVVANAIAAGVGMFPVAIWLGARAYRAAIVGSAAGAVVAALLFTGSMMNPAWWRILPQYCFLIPPVCATAAAARVAAEDPADERV
jgi:hypothetical protein